MNPVNHQIRLAARPSGLPARSDWELTTEPVPAPGLGEFVVAVSHVLGEQAPGGVDVFFDNVGGRFSARCSAGWRAARGSC